jgi:hypothetical protein
MKLIPSMLGMLRSVMKRLTGGDAASLFRASRPSTPSRIWKPAFTSVELTICRTMLESSTTIATLGMHASLE